LTLVLGSIIGHNTIDYTSVRKPIATTALLDSGRRTIWSDIREVLIQTTLAQSPSIAHTSAAYVTFLDFLGKTTANGTLRSNT
jgi:hypothetical protein